MKVDQDIKAIVQAFCSAKGNGSLNIVTIENANIGGGNMYIREKGAVIENEGEHGKQLSIGLLQKQVENNKLLEAREVSPRVIEVSSKERCSTIPAIKTNIQKLKEGVFFTQEQKNNLFNLLSGFHGCSRFDTLMYLLITICYERFTLEKAAAWLKVRRKRLRYYYEKFGFIKGQEGEN